jgi:hypothetical protein
MRADDVQQELDPRLRRQRRVVGVVGSLGFLEATEPADRALHPSMIAPPLQSRGPRPAAAAVSRYVRARWVDQDEYLLDLAIEVRSAGVRAAGPKTTEAASGAASRQRVLPGAGEGIRTLDVNLGKVALYH